jgi:hypothetical protein
MSRPVKPFSAPCAQCGKTFHFKKHHGKRKYCSSLCYRKSRIERPLLGAWSNLVAVQIIRDNYEKGGTALVQKLFQEHGFQYRDNCVRCKAHSMGLHYPEGMRRYGHKSTNLRDELGRFVSPGDPSPDEIMILAAEARSNRVRPNYEPSEDEDELDLPDR